MTSGRKQGVVLLKAVVSVGLLVYVLTICDLPGMIPLAAGLELSSVLLLFGIFLFTFFLNALKWKCLLDSQQIKRMFKELLCIYWIGNFCNFFAIGRVGGDLYRLVAVSRGEDQKGLAMMSVVVDRFTNFFAIVVIGLAASGVDWIVHRDPKNLVISLVFFVILLTVFIAAYTNIFKMPVLIWLHKIPAARWFLGKFESVHHAVKSYFTSMRVVLVILSLSFLFQFIVIFSNYYAARMIGLEIGFFEFLVYVPIIAMVTAIPITIAGFGVRENAYVWFLGKVGVEPKFGVMLSILIYFLSLMFALPGALLFIRSGRHAHDFANETRGGDGE